MHISDLPIVNAVLNSFSTVFLMMGFIFIKTGNKIAHRNCMISALLTSTLFLVSYLTYHYYAGTTRFENPAWFRPIYLTILLTHTILAVAVVPLVLLAFNHAFRERFDKHRRIARWAWPVWMYVSITGVLIYLLLYQIYPQK